MNNDLKELLKQLKYAMAHSEETEKAKRYHDAIIDLQNENKALKELCDKYEEEHNTTFKTWQDEIIKLKGGKNEDN